ncbi:GNAT family N-acetyltransferase [Actinoalloteichus caeruleus]|uniref:GNAT family N-acetyltransferase n=1 Tax=Actinoalloteichus cyanogriseus TaxID=2893586 RepID=UPI00200D3B0A|nr:GNAT family N-acetyltransferase [Actinoalloteichus caeruleus]
MEAAPVASAIRAPRLDLEPLTSRHADELAEALADDRLHEYTGGQPADAARWRQRCLRMNAGPEEPGEAWCNWAARHRATGRIVGWAQATVRWETGGPATALLAWTTAVPWQGRGLATEAARAMTGWLARQGVRRFSATIHPAHRASERVAMAAGLTPTEDVVDGERVWTGAAEVD